MAFALSRATAAALRGSSTRGISSDLSAALHKSSVRYAVTKMQMPAMSPTMTEGGIASWKKQEGEAFTAGDVLLEIETDKATIDVEAQDDGVVGKILVQDGAKNVPVGKLIALLAEEGDDISNLEIPKEDAAAPAEKQQSAPPTTSPSPPEASSKASSDSSASAPQPAVAHTLPPHSKPLFPSVHRLILEHGIQNIDQIKGTGVRGMLTKGDILTHLGKASSPNGTFKPPPSPIAEGRKALGPKKDAPKEVKPLDGAALRRLIVNSMLETSLKARNPAPDYKDADFDSILADYLPPSKKASAPSATVASTPKPAKKDFLDGLY
ncbi:pyruvate dehydrogenase X component [Ephemerocybe angulata]|uniref:Pyruvate dehydrogenase X component n=1 Tax=Ephemerocybe angulata TaxID=980116 RepID=A0A8H6IFX4_9AGAR|nr:pyruvate dehydrogenase X component [Tulosesus angulatus]